MNDLILATLILLCNLNSCSVVLSMKKVLHVTSGSGQIRSDINQPARVQRKSSALKREAMVVVDNKDADQTSWSWMLSLSWVFGVHI